jgi:predicted acyltransferase
MSSSPATAPPQRMVAIDAYRGLVMLLMLDELLQLPRVARNFPDSPLWQTLSFHTSHVAWTGCSLHDLIQPSFSFLVGVALPFSVASRLARGQSFPLQFVHAVWRSLLLIALGIFLRSVGQRQTNFTFEDTLTQIGLGYTFLFLLAYCSRAMQATALVVILVGYWAAFALYPSPESSAFAAHWDKNTNLAWAFDVWYLNLFPRPQPFTANGGGYVTLSFIPTLGTMILGLIAGGWLREEAPNRNKLLYLLLAGAVCMGAGWLLDWTEICPSVKRIWTPAWTLYSGGWCFFFLAGFFAVNEMLGWRWWAFPLVVIGMNSIAIYCLEHLARDFIYGSFRTHLGRGPFQVAGMVYEPLLTGAAALVVFWLILFWMYRRRIFLKI